MLLPTYDVFDEARYFMPAENQNSRGSRTPRWRLPSAKCVERQTILGAAALPARSVDELISAGGKLLISINASPYHMGRRTLRREIFTAAARAPLRSAGLR
jgi:hypothetical protein